MHPIDTLNSQDPNTAQAMLALVQLAHVQESGWLGVEPRPAAADALLALQGQRAFHLGAFSGDTLCGLLTLGPDDEAGQLIITTLVVHPQVQRQGLARQLLQAAFERGPGMTFSVCAATHNQPARQLYQRLGFVAYRQGVVDSSGVPMTKFRRVPNAHPSTDHAAMPASPSP